MDSKLHTTLVFLAGDGLTSPIFLDGFKRENLARLLGQLGCTRGAEIGTAEGKFAIKLCEAIPCIDLTCIDPWAPYEGNGRSRDIAKQDRAFATAQQTLRKYNVTFLRGTSAEMAQHVADQSLDFVYIDGNHKYTYVQQDLLLWSKKVKSGGVVAGHDYYKFKGAGVIEAVNEFTANAAIERWYLTDSIKRRPGNGGDYYKESSFFWVNP